MEEKTVKIEILKNGLLRIRRSHEQDREGFNSLLKEIIKENELSDLDLFLKDVENIELLCGEETFCG
ncbi:MAG TPA: hypothetical protein VMZ91_08360 [Candidatus Paceibacterota bacterium]|nr:hypothetical protein [Candidatus Paceibacterota bacterium]